MKAEELEAYLVPQEQWSRAPELLRKTAQNMQNFGKLDLAYVPHESRWYLVLSGKNPYILYKQAADPEPRPIPTAEQASHHITLCYPLRAIAPAHRAGYGYAYLVGFQRGFEQLEVAVYAYVKNSKADAEESAVEYMIDHYPDSLTEDEKVNREATSVRLVRRPK
jgi:hypothetical protein